MTGTDIQQAVEILKHDGLVAIPTETVYGLAGNALKEYTVTKIFEAKNRPSFDPLIIHLADLDQWEDYAEDIHPLFKELAACYCPGPLTFLVRKRKNIPDLVTSGLPYVAVRFPSHPLTRAVLKGVHFPLAAPSANPFGYISPTTAAHVEAQLKGKVDYILDGGPCEVGLESTIIGMEGGSVTVLRKGGFDVSLIHQHTSMPVRYYEASTSNPSAPGMLSSHYAPQVPFYLTDDIESFIANHPNKKTGVLCFGQMDRKFPNAAMVRDLSPVQDLAEAARNLFAYMRAMDSGGLEMIVAERVSAEGLGLGINDRLYRASVK
jgi:L-threonylcarbamoyladenylate synthase